MNEKKNRRWKSRKILRTIAVWVSTAFGSFVVFTGCVAVLLLFYNMSLGEFSSLQGAEGLQVSLWLCWLLGVSAFLSVYIFAGHPAAFVAFMWPAVVYVREPIFWLVLGPAAIGAIAGYYLNRYTYHRQRQALQPGGSPSFWDLNLVRVLLYLLAVILLATVVDYDHFVGWIFFAAQTLLYAWPSLWALEKRTDARVWLQDA